MVYGSQPYAPADASGTKTIPLNAAAVAAITATAGAGDFALGGAITTLDNIANFEFVYGASNDLSPALPITTLPEPLTISILGPLALLCRRRSVC